MIGVGAAVALAAFAAALSPGVSEGACRAGENGPAFLVTVQGLRDAAGALKLEVYPPNDADFLEHDTVLIAAGKTFRRVELQARRSGAALCIRVPGPGRYAVSLLHDRNGNGRFDFLVDGVGFAGNPRLRLGKPAASIASAQAGPGITRLTIVVNYRHGFGMAPDRP